jgi:hypothetical protein
MLAKKQQVYYSCKIIRSQLSPFPNLLCFSRCKVNLRQQRKFTLGVYGGGGG